MLERTGPARLVGGVIRPLLILGVSLLVACGSPTGSTPPSAAVSSAPSVAPSAPPSASASAAAVVSPSAESPSATPSAGPTRTASPVPDLDPEQCPPTVPDGLYRTSDGIQIDGDADFIAHVERALALLEEEAAASYADVLENVAVLRSVRSFSGMCYDTGTYRVGDETAHAPGYPVDRQVVWLAGTIVHDACHRARFVAGLEPSGRDAELACLQAQVAALRIIDKGKTFAGYVQGLIDGVDDPSNQYWTNPDRHW
jgi:hypothetical protein